MLLRQAECKVQQSPYYANIEDSIFALTLKVFLLKKLTHKDTFYPLENCENN